MFEETKKDKAIKFIKKVHGIEDNKIYAVAFASDTTEPAYFYNADELANFIYGIHNTNYIRFSDLQTVITEERSNIQEGIFDAKKYFQ